MKSLGPKLNAAAATRLAALNNAQWCAAMWAAHGCVVEQECGVCFTRSIPPPLYPNAVTFDPVANSAEQVLLIAQLAREERGFAVKDSFASLNLEACGFHELFSASWMWGTDCSVKKPGLDWRRVRTPAMLAIWERHWRRDASDPVGLFNSKLLDDERVRIMAGFDGDGAMAAGGIAFVSGGVIGLSNMSGDTDSLWAAVTQECGEPLAVRYERPETLPAALTEGFRQAGLLQVWRKAEAKHGGRTRART